MADPKGFLKFSRCEPEKRPAPERVRDSKEFHVPVPETRLREQASRCMDCGVPFCQGANGCPVENLIPDWNDKVRQGRWKEALELLHATNNFPEFTGKLCPAPCESACVLGITDSPVTIRSIESSIIDRGFDEQWVQPLRPARLTGKKVAVVGSGPAGLAAAQQLARSGHFVTVFEKADRAGGLLRYGIPDFKMEKWVLDRRLRQMEEEGVVFKTGIDVGVDIAAADLRAGHDAICLALGAERPRDLSIPGRELRGIHFAMDYLVQQNRRIAGLPFEGEPIEASGKRVIILGGGDTGSDCLGTVHRQGCAEVSQFELLPAPSAERHSSTPWPLWPMMLKSSHAHEEGGKRLWSVSTLEFLGRDRRVRGLRAVEVERVNGSFVPRPGTELELEADLVLLAMGFTGPKSPGLLEQLGVALDPRGNVAVDSSFMTNIPGVFAAGDVKRGASLIVWAISEGRKMAATVDQVLGRGNPCRAYKGEKNEDQLESQGEASVP